MPPGAHVTSVESLEAFRASLVLYLSKARPALDEVSADVVRTRLWLQNDQRLRWENELRRRTKVLEQAQQALFSAGISTLRTANDTEKMAVHRAKYAVEEAAAKLKLVKQWSREFDSQTDPLVKQLEKLQTILTNDMLKALSSLAGAIKSLEAYAEVLSPGASAEALPAGAPGVAEDASAAAGQAAAAPPGAIPEDGA
jgi:hypothetical protein